MFWQIAVISGCIYGISKNLNVKERKIRKDFRDIVEKTGLINKKNESLRAHKIEQRDFGFLLTAGVPYGIGFENIEQKSDIFKTNYGAKDVQFERLENGSMVKMTVITNPMKDIVFEPKPTKPYEIYIGYTIKENLITSLNKFPHMLITGATGTGKSRLSLCILTNLIATHKDDIEIYLVQLRKGDLKVFMNCYQVKYFADKLVEANKTLKHIDSICKKRDKLIDKYIMDGIYNIEDWNKRFKSDMMTYIYVFTDEFAFFMPGKADSKAEKGLKQECLAYIKNIALTGRSNGIFLFTSLQRPDKTSIPTDIKSQINIRLSFKQIDDSSSISVLGNGNATGLPEREAIIQTNYEEHIKVPFIDDKIMKKYISDSIVMNHKNIELDRPITEDSPVKNPKQEKQKDTFNNDGIVDLAVISNADREG